MNENENENENQNQNENENKNKIVKDSNIKELIEKPKEVKSPNWVDKNKFKKIVTIMDSNKFGHKNKIGNFKYIDIRDLVNNIKDNTISEIDAKNGLNGLNKIKKAGIIEYKKRTPKQKELLNLLNDLLDVILTDKTLKSETQKDNTLMSSKGENENENDKALMSSNDDDDDKENEDENENDKTLIIIK